MTQACTPRSKHWSNSSEARMAEVWSEARVKELHRLIAERLSFGEIALLLGVTRNACLGKASRLKIKVPKRPPAVRPPVKRMLREAWAARIASGIARQRLCHAAAAGFADRSARHVDEPVKRGLR